MIGKRKLVLALFAIAVLLVNPAGICAGTPSVQSPSHPCCPAPPAQHHGAGSGTGSCVCIDRQPAPPSVPPLDSSHSTAVTATEVRAPLITIGTEVMPVSDRAHFTARFLTFHQILV